MINRLLLAAVFPAGLIVASCGPAGTTSPAEPVATDPAAPLVESITEPTDGALNETSVE